MRVPDDHPLSITLALRKPDTAVAAVEALRPLIPGKVTIDGLAELVIADPSAKAVVAALEAIAEVDDPLVPIVMRRALTSRFAQARLAAVQWWGRGVIDPGVVQVLRTDPSWPNRRAALLALAHQEDDDRWQVLAAADDPHWRVRHALVRVLTEWGSTEDGRQEVRRRFDSWFMQGLAETTFQRLRALLTYLDYAWTGIEPTDGTWLTPPDPHADCPFWDWDPAVLGVKLTRMTGEELAASIDAMPFLAAHADERVWKPAVDAIRAFGELRHYKAVSNRLVDPRLGGQPAAERLLDGLEEERKEALAQFFWVVKGKRPVPLPTHTRAATLTPEAAARIVADPTTETSWTVIEAACRIARVPLWEVEPANPWTSPPKPPATPTPLAAPLGVSPHTVSLGPDHLRVSRVGISGHYLLPVEGFVRAAAAGVNWFFWEPNYATLTAFSTRLSAADRRQFHFVAGTFEADGKRVRADVDRALRALKVEQLGLFLVFWVQSWERMTDDLRDAVARLTAEGKVRAVGLSSHNRPLLVRAMADGWNPVMARHSPAHRGAETGVFPFVPPGTSLITFNNLCYGRMLRPVGGLMPPTAADCYRYTLSFPQVSACWSAPATLEQLEENLAALWQPELSGEKRAELERFGAALYRDEKMFERLIRMV